MNGEERRKIFELLAQYYPNAKQLKDRQAMTAWRYALERFTYADVKNAVVDYALSHKYFPDVADITANLSPSAPAADAGSVEIPSDNEWVRRYVARDGGPCLILRRHMFDAHDAPGSGFTGVILRSFCPEECVGCGRLNNSSCSVREDILREQARCPILKKHGAEGARADVLRRYWETECFSCHTPCAWCACMLTASFRGH